jgi:predicted RNase H-like HicB family nuclease
MRDAIVGHLEELRESGLPIPAASKSARYVEVAA